MTKIILAFALVLATGSQSAHAHGSWSQAELDRELQALKEDVKDFMLKMATTPVFKACVLGEEIKGNPELYAEYICAFGIEESLAPKQNDDSVN